MFPNLAFIRNRLQSVLEILKSQILGSGAIFTGNFLIFLPLRRSPRDQSTIKTTHEPTNHDRKDQKSGRNNNIWRSKKK